MQFGAYTFVETKRDLRTVEVTSASPTYKPRSCAQSNLSARRRDGCGRRCKSAASDSKLWLWLSKKDWSGSHTVTWGRRLGSMDGSLPAGHV
jgi:hypothetical protein